MSSSGKDRAYVEDCLRSVERLLREGDLELAGLTLDFAHPDLGRMADEGQAGRLQAAKQTLGRGESGDGIEGVAPGGYGPH